MRVGSPAVAGDSHSRWINFWGARHLAAGAGKTLDIDTFTFDIARASTNGAASYFVRSSVDSYASNLSEAFNFIGTSAKTVTVDLTTFGTAFDNLSGDVEFRVYIHGRGNTTTSSGTYLDNVSFAGEAIPEPSAALLGAIGMLCLLRRRR
ncbi:MAG: PEP-CTERM sorting domain-containing protein [Luteolibacter sp.]